MKIKKVKLQKELKLGIVIIGTLATVALIFFAIKAYQTPIISSDKQTLYKYTNEIDANYSVVLKENQLYREKTLPENQFYVSSFVKDIPLKINMKFESDKEAQVKGNYEITTRLQGFDLDREEQKTVIWTRKQGEPIKGDFDFKGIKQDVTKELIVPFGSYNEFATAVIEAAKAYTQAEIVVNVNGKKTITIEGETKEVPINANIYIPLMANYFSVTKEGVEPIEEVGTKTIEKELPPNKPLAIKYGLLAFISLGATLFLVFFTTQPTEEDKALRKRKKLFNEYGSRMVAIDDIEESPSLEIYHVIKLDDLIKIADELEKPVFYIDHKDILCIKKFYVKEQKNLYIYEIKEENIEQDDEKQTIENKPEEVVETQQVG